MTTIPPLQLHGEVLTGQFGVDAYALIGRNVVNAGSLSSQRVLQERWLTGTAWADWTDEVAVT